MALLRPLAFVDVPPGGSVENYEDGVLAAVSVVKDANGALTLRINNRQQEGSSTTLRVDGRQAWLPLLLHPHPQQVLFLGLGTGMTSTAAALVPPLQVTTRHVSVDDAGCSCAGALLVVSVCAFVFGLLTNKQALYSQQHSMNAS